ncbi:MAG: response regulator transcription factor [Bacteroidetes bacterium]|jgi:DNA-binding response OmpR family regulator|nr:response regulator transcription factor [Bacteroidota bacterium]
MNILLIEDDKTLNQNISEALKAESINTTSLYDGNLAERILKRESFDCIIMDINLPGKNGFDLCRDFRKFNSTTPVIMLTAFAELDDKIQGYDCGADDYLTKPFYMRELLLRINSLIKRTNSTTIQNVIINADDIVIDTKTKSVTRQGQNISLTPREYQILIKLTENKGEVISKNELIKEIWGNTLEVNTNTIEVYINFLRNKIEKPFNKQNIKTKVGYGYYFE